MFRVDLGEVFAGRRTARWALGFVGRLSVHPWSMVRARMRGGDDGWPGWYGWGHAENKIAEGTNYLIAVNTPADRRAHEVWVPQVTVSQPRTLEDASAQLISML